MNDRGKGPEERKSDARKMALWMGALIVVLFAAVGWGVTTWIDQYEWFGTLSGALLGSVVWLGIWLFAQR